MEQKPLLTLEDLKGMIVSSQSLNVVISLQRRFDAKLAATTLCKRGLLLP